MTAQSFKHLIPFDNQYTTNSEHGAKKLINTNTSNKTDSLVITILDRGTLALLRLANGTWLDGTRIFVNRFGPIVKVVGLNDIVKGVSWVTIRGFVLLIASIETPAQAIESTEILEDRSYNTYALRSASVAAFRYLSRAVSTFSQRFGSFGNLLMSQRLRHISKLPNGRSTMKLHSRERQSAYSAATSVGCVHRERGHGSDRQCFVTCHQDPRKRQSLEDVT
jgi:hypothetical protein